MGFLKDILSLFKSGTAKGAGHLHGLQKAKASFGDLVERAVVPLISVGINIDDENIITEQYKSIQLKQNFNHFESPLRIASISKCITAVALGKMVDEGLMDWNDSVYRYVPEFPDKGFDITIKQLASHTAGIRGYRGKEYALNHDWGIEEGINIFKEDPLEFEPGTDYLYNSFGFCLLSLAMQRASGQPFENYVREKVLDPLGMVHTFSPRELEKQINTEKVEYYSKRKNGFKKAIDVNNDYKIAGGGYLSTTSDLVKFGQAILDGKLLSKDSYDQILSAQSINGKSIYYGLGFQVSQDQEGRPYFGHIGNGVGAYSNFFCYPNGNLVVAILINCTDPKVQSELDGILKRLFQELVNGKR